MPDNVPKCPECGRILTRREAIPGKLCCDSCRKFYDEDSLPSMPEAVMEADVLSDEPPEDDGGEPPAGWYRDDMGRLVKKGHLVEQNMSEFSLSALACGVIAVCLSVFPYVNLAALLLALVGAILASMLRKCTGTTASQAVKYAKMTTWCCVAAVAITLVTNVVSCQLATEASQDIGNILAWLAGGQ